MTDRKPKAFSVRFTGSPPVGSTISLRGDDFVLTRAEPYTRRDGGETSLLTWSSWCKTCGQAYNQNTGRSFSSLRKNCDPCRVDWKSGRGMVKS